VLPQTPYVVGRSLLPPSPRTPTPLSALASIFVPSGLRSALRRQIHWLHCWIGYLARVDEARETEEEERCPGDCKKLWQVLCVSVCLCLQVLTIKSSRIETV